MARDLSCASLPRTLLSSLASSGICVAPGTYTGPCSVAMYLEDMPKKDKARLAASCGFQWPCRFETTNSVAGAELGHARLQNGPL